MLHRQIGHAESSVNKGLLDESKDQHEVAEQPSSGEHKFKQFICGEEALKISPTEPYCLHRPIRRGHFNISEYYPMQQVQSSCFYSLSTADVL